MDFTQHVANDSDVSRFASVVVGHTLSSDNQAESEASVQRDIVEDDGVQDSSLRAVSYGKNTVELDQRSHYEVPYPRTIQYALAISFIIASLFSVMFATTCLGRLIWSISNKLFAKLANGSDPSPEEIERSRREAHIIEVSDAVKVVITRRYVHGMRYWQEMAMVVVKYLDCTIFYNPVPMPIDDMRALAHGKNVLIVVPNMYHHMFVDDYTSNFESATVVGSQSAATRHNPHLSVVLPSMLKLPEDVELLHVDGWALDEYVMVVHSARVICAAHFIACGVEVSVGGGTLLPTWLKKLVCRAVCWQPAGCLPLYERLAVSNKDAIASFVARLHDLQLATSISAHGGICRDDANTVLQHAWGWTQRRRKAFTQTQGQNEEKSVVSRKCETAS